MCLLEKEQEEGMACRRDANVTQTLPPWHWHSVWVVKEVKGEKPGLSEALWSAGSLSSSGFPSAGQQVSVGARGHLEMDQTAPTSVLPASTWQGWKISHLFAGSELCVPLPPALRWWTSVSHAAFWTGREQSQTGHLVYQHEHLVCPGAELISCLHHTMHRQWQAHGQVSLVHHKHLGACWLTMCTPALHPHVTQREPCTLWGSIGGNCCGRLS